MNALRRQIQEANDELANEAVLASETATGFIIEDAIAIPTERAGGGGKAKYPWADLNKGQSFFVPAGKLKAFYTMCSTQTKKYEGKRKFIARAWDGPNSVKGVRVWRSE